MNTEERILNIEGSEVHVLETGKVGGDAIVLLHGMKFQAETWRELGTLEYLASRGFHCLAVDLPGFGRSSVGQAKPTEVLEALITEFKLVKPILLGPSMGGRICLEFCLQQQDLVGGLVLVAPVGVVENQEKLAGIRVPVLAVWGSEDSISPLENGKVLQREIEMCRLVVIAGAPHPCYLDNAERFHQEVADFLYSLKE